MKCNRCRPTLLIFVVGVALVVSSAIEAAQSSSEGSDRVNEVLEWNQISIAHWRGTDLLR
jgi:hypothetical protein